MEFSRSSDDCFAGYLQEDSDLEFSGCSDEVSSEEDEGVGSKHQCHVTQHTGVMVNSGGWSDDEFETEMESELVSVLKSVASSDILVATATAAASQTNSTSRTSKKRKKGAISVNPKSHQDNLSSSLITAESSLVVNSSRRQERGVQLVQAEGKGKEGVEEERVREEGEKGEGEEGRDTNIDETAAYYDKLYFESSSSEDDDKEEEKKGGGGGDEVTMTMNNKRKKNKDRKTSSTRKDKQCHRKLTNEELFYDPHMDEEDEQWVKRQRMAYHNVQVSQQLEQQQRQRMTHTHPPRQTEEKGSEGEGEGENKRERNRSGPSSNDLPTKSDAHLSCPACMTTVCLDCQQHAVYNNQFRAMFVMNCRISKDEVLKHIPKPSKKEKQKKKWKERRKEREGGGGESVGGEGGGSEGFGGAGEGGVDEADNYHPVHCAECNTEIAVYDRDEVFHFFNVLASAAS